MRFFYALIIVFLCLNIFSCADKDDGEARINLNLKLAPSEKQEIEITRVIVTVSGFDIQTQEFELKVEGRKATGAIAIPAGEERNIVVRAYAGDSLEYEGSTIVDHPKPGQEIRVDLTLKPVRTQEAEVIFENGNIGGVYNRPTKDTVFTINEPYVITEITNYHWNNGNGATPGTIALKGANKTYGPWKASGKPGQGGVPNAYWIVYPNETIPAGTYTVIDSDPNTWSQNFESNGEGFTRIVGYPASRGTGTDTSGNDAKMVLIPAGEFVMGSDDEGYNARPAHTVYLDAFYIDMYEVTNAQYRKFIQATGRKEPEGYKLIDDAKFDYEEWGFKPWSDPNFNAPDMPVVCVSWEDANAYAKWVGKRLPTEAEWEKAARGGLVGQKYPWGNNLPPTSKVGNLADISFRKAFNSLPIIEQYNDGWTYIAPVGKFPPNKYGLYDMCGNVSEWCSDWYDENYYSNSPKQNPKGATSGIERSVRGSSWAFWEPDMLYNSMRGYLEPQDAYNFVGFRCAKSK
ncbi:TPA: formylglycine-generating enzyme family protein [Candidatus Poribacteria bacterium]|nr:formylglycine-generating enzyme family protein [Candidatus Poribacteria bacterium]